MKHPSRRRTIDRWREKTEWLIWLSKIQVRLDNEWTFERAEIRRNVKARRQRRR